VGAQACTGQPRKGLATARGARRVSQTIFSPECVILRIAS